MNDPSAVIGLWIGVVLSIALVAGTWWAIAQSKQPTAIEGTPQQEEAR